MTKDGVRTTKQDRIPNEPTQEEERLQKASRTRKRCKQFCKSLAASEESGLNVDQLRRKMGICRTNFDRTEGYTERADTQRRDPTCDNEEEV